MVVRRAREAPWWPAAAALLLATLALGAALLVPLAFSDPNGVDPYVARLSGTALLLVALTLATRRLAGARPVMLAVVAVTGSFTLLAAGPQILVDLFPPRPGTPFPAVLSGAAQVFWASLAQLLATVAVMVVAARLLPAGLRPAMRLRRIGPGAVLLAAGITAVLLLAGLALPASLLGRDGLQPVQITRDLPWLGPASVMQAFSQEAQFRSLLMGALERVMGRGWANLAQAVFFGLTHLAVNYQGPVAPFIPVTIAVGLALGWIVQRTNSIWPAVVIHAAADIAITVAVLPGLYGY